MKAHETLNPMKPYKTSPVWNSKPYEALCDAIPGLASPLLAQVVDGLRNALPNIGAPGLWGVKFAAFQYLAKPNGVY